MKDQLNLVLEELIKVETITPLHYKKGKNKFLINGEFYVIFTSHAQKRIEERGLEYEEVIRRVDSLPMDKWILRGLVAKFEVRNKIKRIIVKTAYYPNIDKREALERYLLT